MITNATGNLLQADADALVNTVNTVGVMGKGIALQFRKAYPEMFAAYAKACKAGEVRLGQMHVWETGALNGPRFIINFPTKGHWRSGSKISDIDAGLSDLMKVITDRGITSIALPPLGCGNGGLDWSEVEPRILAALTVVPDLDVRIYAPGSTPGAASMTNTTKAPNMTVGRAALVTLLGRYSQVALGATPLEVQKLMYFLQVIGEPLQLKYAKNRYGPYADNLRHVLNTVEGHYLTGFGDGSSRVLEAEPIRTLPGAAEAANRVLVDHPDTAARVEEVQQIVDGFESMYGMELLATVHWVTTESRDAAKDWHSAVEHVHRWTPRKKRMFTEDHIRVAFFALDLHGLLPAD